MDRGFFGVGVEYSSKAGNIGAIYRSAHAFGASFLFSINANYDKTKASDTSSATQQLPYYKFNSLDRSLLPQKTKIIGVELTDNAIELPNFFHPSKAVYILGPEKGMLSDSVLSLCDYTLKIPTKFCINVSLAAAITFYDRTISKPQYRNRAINEKQTRNNITHIHGGKYATKILEYKSQIDFPTDDQYHK